MEKVFNKAMRIFLVSLFSVITILALLQVGSRFFGVPMSWTDEVMRYLFIWFAFLGSAYAIREKKHIVVDFISDSLSNKTLRIIEIIVHLVMLFLIFVLIKYGFEVASVTGIQKSPNLRISMSYAFSAIPVSGIFMLIYTLLNLKDLLLGKEESS